MSKAKISVSLYDQVATINPNVYGHFAEHLGACIYGGAWVGEDSPIPNIGGIRRDVVEALRNIKPAVIRWPGGCFADDYHWQDGIGARASRPRRVNIWWGKAIESNAFGTHEFIRFCRLVGAEPYICGNVGSGSPTELRNWVEYCNFPAGTTLSDLRAANGSPEPFNVRYWGVGNENWGCGGSFCPEDYGVEYKRFATYLQRGLDDPAPFLIACGPNGNNTDWTRRFLTKIMPQGRLRINGYAAHLYFGTAGTATEYTEEQYYQLIQRCLAMETLIRQQRGLLDGFDPERKIGLIIDEWGTWHAGRKEPEFMLWQQNTVRDAVIAALSLDTFNRHADTVVMSNIAQTINVLQALILTDGPKMITTPTYHVYEMYQHHQGGQSLRTVFEADPISFKLDEKAESMAGLNGSASLKDGVLTLSVVNPSATAAVETSIELFGGQAKSGALTVLAHADIHAHNTFESPATVAPQTGTLAVSSHRLNHTFPPASVTVFRLQLG